MVGDSPGFGDRVRWVPRASGLAWLVGAIRVKAVFRRRRKGVAVACRSAGLGSPRRLEERGTRGCRGGGLAGGLAGLRGLVG